MRCTVCGGRRFERTTYRSREAACPALSCDECGAIALDEQAAEGSEERISVRLAIAKRATLWGDELGAGFPDDVTRTGCSAV